MFKIELSDEIIKLHKQYFKMNIIPELKSKKVKFVIDDVIKMNEEYGKKYTIDYIQKTHDKFIKYCIYNVNKIAIGKFDDLKNVQFEIKRLFPVIIFLIKEKFVFSNANPELKGEKYWDVLFNLFGYEKFEKCDFLTVIKDLAKKKTSIDNLRINENRKKVEQEMRNILKKLFPKVESKVDKELICTDSSGKEIAITIDEFKLKLNEFENKYSLGITLDNCQNSVFNNIWNAYIFVLKTQIRTCPYCNRQYITPVFTASGMMRGALDHFLAKYKYPYFSMSLYNLIPVCHSCNSSFKGITDFDFNDINPYKESMDDYIKFRAYIKSRKPIHIKISRKNKNKKISIDKFTNTFKLELQYNYHINQVKELIFKRRHYSDEYIKDLNKKTKIPEKIIKEKLIGYTEDKLKINDEPLSKFRRDIVKQLKFFDDKNKNLIDTLEEIISREK